MTRQRISNGFRAVITTAVCTSLAAALLVACANEQGGPAAIGAQSVASPTPTPTARTSVASIGDDTPAAPPITLSANFTTTEELLASVEAAGVLCDSRAPFSARVNNLGGFTCGEDSSFSMALFSDAEQVAVAREVITSSYRDHPIREVDQWVAYGGTWIVTCYVGHSECDLLQAVFNGAMVFYSDTGVLPSTSAGLAPTTTPGTAVTVEPTSAGALIWYSSPEQMMKLFEDHGEPCTASGQNSRFDVDTQGTVTVCASGDEVFILVTYPTEADLSAALDLSRSRARGESVSVLVGANWSVACEARRSCPPAQEILGGEIVKLY